MRPSGFTLAELLISLAILGVIATFTIPKVLNSQQNAEFKAKGKEAASIISGVFQAYKLENQVTSNTQFAEMTQYINYIAIQTTMVDHRPSLVNGGCQLASIQCFKLANGGTLWFHQSFDGFNEGTAGQMNILFDPDGVQLITPESKSVEFYLFQNGRITNSNDNPVWFSWD